MCVLQLPVEYPVRPSLVRLAESGNPTAQEELGTISKEVCPRWKVGLEKGCWIARLDLESWKRDGLFLSLVQRDLGSVTRLGHSVERVLGHQFYSMQSPIEVH